MASAIFIVPMGPIGPELDAEALRYAPQPGQIAGGFACVGHVPQAPTCLVRVWATAEMLDALAADERYLFVEDVSDGD